MIKKLNLGCGNDIKPGYVNMDRYNANGVDIVYDLEKFPYPFKDNTFDEIFAQDIIEHISPFFDVMNELHRISKNKTILKIQVPHFSSATAFHTSHKLFFRYKSFQETTFDLDLVNFSKKFKVLKRKIIFIDRRFKLQKFLIHNYLCEAVFNKIPLIYENSFLRSLFPAIHIYFELEAIK